MIAGNDERIALLIDTEARLDAIRQTRAELMGVSDAAKQTAAAAEAINGPFERTAISSERAAHRGLAAMERLAWGAQGAHLSAESLVSSMSNLSIAVAQMSESAVFAEWALGIGAVVAMVGILIEQFRKLDQEIKPTKLFMDQLQHLRTDQAQVELARLTTERDNLLTQMKTATVPATAKGFDPFDKRSMATAAAETSAAINNWIEETKKRLDVLNADIGAIIKRIADDTTATHAKLHEQALEDAKRAIVLEEQLQFGIKEAKAKGRGDKEALAQLEADAEFQRQLREIKALEVSEAEKVKLMEMAVQRRIAIKHGLEDVAARETIKKAEEEQQRLQRIQDEAVKHLEGSMQAALHAALLGQQSIGKALVAAALEPIVRRLEALAISELVEAGFEFAFLNFAGGARHLAVAAAATAGAAEVASLGGLTHGGGGGGGAATGGGGVGTFSPSGSGEGAGGVTIILQTVRPTDRSIIDETAYELNQAQILKRPILPPTTGFSRIS